MSNTPKTLIYDIEVSPCLGWFWGTGKTSIGAHQILRPGKIICISYRFTDWPEGKVEHLRWKPKRRNNRFSVPYTDKYLVKEFAKIAEEADIIVGHNGDNFDKKWINTRLAYYGFPTLEHVLTEDTLKQVRQQFRLPSFRLDFVCKYFNIPGKLSTVTGLWQKIVFEDKPEYLDEMVAYCDQDVLILDQLYKRIYPYVKHRINRGIYNGEINICPRCGSKHRESKGHTYTTMGKFKSWLCKNCGHRYRDGVNLATGGRHVGR